MNACPACHGDGYHYDPTVDENSAPMCESCDGTGVVEQSSDEDWDNEWTPNETF